MSPLLLLIGPVVLAAVGCLFYKPAGQRIAKLVTDYKPARLIIFILLAGAGTCGTIALDQLDLSDLVFADRKHSEQELNRILTDLDGLYGVKNVHLESLSSRIKNVADQLEPMRTSVSVHLLALLAGCSAGFFLLVSVFNLSAEGVLAKESAEAETWYQMYQKTLDVLANVNTVVVAKINRIKRLTKEFGDRGTADRVTVCRTALNPEDQVQTLVACVHEFFWQNIAGLKLRVALFVPHANYLVVKASTDGDAHNVVTSPNRENKHFFSLESDPRCIAVRAFKYRVPIILPDCSKDEHFTYFSEIQKNQIKSMVACPLCHGERQDLGVLVVDASEDEFFEANPVFETMLKLLGEQIALRLSLEECVSNLFTTFENAETKERT